MGSWLTGNQASANDPQQPATALRIQTSIQGRPITILWGTQRVAANLIWQGAFASRTVQVGSVGSNNWLDHIFSKAQPIFQTFYSTSVLFALCHGTVTADTLTNKAWNGTTATTIAALGFTVFRGDFAQVSWSYLVSAFPTQAFPYRGTSLVGQANFELGTSSDLPVLCWEPQSDISGFGPDGKDANPADVVLDVVSNLYYGVEFPFYRMDQQLAQFFQYGPATGMVVSPIITEQVSAQEFLTDLFEALNSSPRWSSGVLTVVPWGDSAITAGAITTFTDAPYTIPPSVNNYNPQIQVGGGGFVSDGGVKYAAGGTPFVQVSTTTSPGTGQYFVTPSGLYQFSANDATVDILITWDNAATASYTPDITPLYDLTADEFLPNQGSLGSSPSGDEPVAWLVNRQADQLNVIKYEYLDRANNYDPVAIDFKDEASIVTYGKRPSELKTRHLFTLPDAAQQSASLECIRQQIPATCQWTLGPAFILPDVEDIVTLTRPTMGLDRQPVRITEIQENQDGSLTFTAEVFMGTAAAPLYGTQVVDANNVDLLADPGPVSDVRIFVAPTGLANPPSGQIALMAAVAGSDTNYGGSNVYFSTDNITFNPVGIVPQCTMGTLTADLPDHSSPDTVNTLSVDLTESRGVIPANTHDNADHGLPPCIIDAEVVSYGDETLTSAYNYDLTYLTRGNYSTLHAAHVSGTSFVLINGFVFTMNVPDSLVGQTVYFKFQPYNIYGGGLPDLSTITSVPFTIGASVGTFAGTSFFSSFTPTKFDTGATLINTTLSGGNLVAQHANTSLGGARSINYETTGKFYFEMTLNVVTAGVSGVCVLPSDMDYTTTDQGAAMFAPSGNIWAGGGFSGASLGAIVSGNVIGCAADVGAGLVWFRLGAAGNWNDDVGANPATGTGGFDMNVATTASRAPAIVFGDTGSDGTEKATANFGASAFVGTVPTGFTPGWY